MNGSKRVMGVDYRQVLSSLGVFSSAFIITALSSIILTSISLSNAAELPTSNSDLDVSVSVTPVIAIRTLDSTATSEISALNFDITPAASGTRESQTTIVDVSTSNVSGYNLLMQSDYKNDGVYTTDLVHTNAEIATTLPGKIPTESLSTASTTSYWNYTKSWNEVLGPTGHTESFSSSALPTSSTNDQLIPAHNTPATIRNDVDMATASSKTNVDVNVNIAADKSSGDYKNRLVFTAVANPIPVDYTLTFNKNTEDTVENFPSPITDTNVATSHAFTIPDTSTMARSGYTFVGWSEDPNTRQGTGTGPDGLYVAGDTFTVNADDPSQPDYSQHGVGSATLYAVWQLCTANSICYIANANDVDGTMDNQTTVYMTSTTSAGSTDSTALSSSTAEFTLYSPNFARANYGFAGWNTKADGTGTMYGPNQTLTTSDGTLTSQMQSDLGSKGLIFYAQWVASTGNMQSWSGCSSLAQDSVTALTDTRDNQVYAVAKLVDGKCWMVENLRYTAGGSSSNSWSTIITDKQYNYTNINNADSTKSPTTSDGTDHRWYSYGNYYSWAAAINSTTAYSSGTAPAPGICPTGWRVPTSNGASTDFPNLNGALTGSTSSVSTFAASSAWRTYPNNFVFAGNWYGSKANNRGTSGRYWSSSVYNSNYSYALYLHSSLVYPNSLSFNKLYGLSVRCLV